MAYLAVDAPVFFHARGHGATSAWGGAEAAWRWPSWPRVRAPCRPCVLERPRSAARAQATSASCRSWLGPRRRGEEEQEATGESNERIRQASGGSACIAALVIR